MRLCANPGRDATARSLYAIEVPPRAGDARVEGREPSTEKEKGKKWRPALSVRVCFLLEPSRNDHSWLQTTYDIEVAWFNNLRKAQLVVNEVYTVYARFVGRRRDLGFASELECDLLDRRRLCEEQRDMPAQLGRLDILASSLEVEVLRVDDNIEVGFFLLSELTHVVMLWTGEG